MIIKVENQDRYNIKSQGASLEGGGGFPLEYSHDAENAYSERTFTWSFLPSRKMCIRI